METPTNLDPNSNPPPSSQGGSSKDKTIILIAAGIALLVITAGIVIGYLAVSPLKPKTSSTLPPNQPTNTPQPKITSPQSKEVNLSPTPLPTTTSPQLSNDDSINTLKKELEQTSIDQFSTDLEEINQEINSL